MTQHFSEDQLAKTARIFEQRFGDTLRLHRIELRVGRLEGMVNELTILPQGIKGLGFVCRDYVAVTAVQSIFKSMNKDDVLATVPYRAESEHGGSVGNGAAYEWFFD